MFDWVVRDLSASVSLFYILLVLNVPACLCFSPVFVESLLGFGHFQLCG